MSTTEATPETTVSTPAAPSARPLQHAIVFAGLATIAVIALLLPAWPAGEDMGSTHYMGLLAANQPWNLLLFMATPVILAETVAVTELVILFSANAGALVRRLNRWASLIGGFYFVGVFVYLVDQAVIPLSTDGLWRGAADVIAVGFYLLGVVPLLGLALIETRTVGAAWDDRTRLRAHATMVGVFLVVAHIAMIAGMLDPGVLGWSPADGGTDGATMPGMDH